MMVMLRMLHSLQCLMPTVEDLRTKLFYLVSRDEHYPRTPVAHHMWISCGWTLGPRSSNHHVPGPAALILPCGHGGPRWARVSAVKLSWAVGYMQNICLHPYIYTHLQDSTRLPIHICRFSYLFNSTRLPTHIGFLCVCIYSYYICIRVFRICIEAAVAELIIKSDYLGRDEFRGS